MCSLVCRFFLFCTDTFSSCLLSGRVWCLAGCWCITCSWKFQPLTSEMHHSYPCSVSWFNRIDLQSQQKGPLLSHSWKNRRAGNAFDRSSMRWMCAISKLKCEVESLTNSFCQREWVKRVQALGLRSLLSLLLLWKTSRGVCWAHVHVYFRSTCI